MEVRVAVTRESERRQTRLLHVDAKFLLQFPDQGLLGTFARLDLAAGEFPQAGPRLACGPLGEQHAAVRVDQGAGGNKNEFDAHGLGLEG